MKYILNIAILFLGILIGAFVIPKIYTQDSRPNPKIALDIVGFFKENMRLNKSKIENEIVQRIRTKSKDTLSINEKLLVISNFDNNLKTMDRFLNSKQISLNQFKFPIIIPPLVPPPCENVPPGGCLPGNLINLLSFPDDNNKYIFEVLNENGKVITTIKSIDATSKSNGFKNIDFKPLGQVRGKIKLRLSIEGENQSFTTSDLIIK